MRISRFTMFLGLFLVVAGSFGKLVPKSNAECYVDTMVDCFWGLWLHQQTSTSCHEIDGCVNWDDPCGVYMVEGADMTSGSIIAGVNLLENTSQTQGLNDVVSSQEESLNCWQTFQCWCEIRWPEDPFEPLYWACVQTGINLPDQDGILYSAHATGVVCPDDNGDDEGV